MGDGTKYVIVSHVHKLRVLKDQFLPLDKNVFMHSLLFLSEKIGFDHLTIRIKISILKNNLLIHFFAYLEL